MDRYSDERDYDRHTHTHAHTRDERDGRGNGNGSGEERQHEAYRIMIPNGCIGNVIGTRGAHVKGIKEATKAHIKVCITCSHVCVLSVCVVCARRCA